jgi:hypothetical protein
MDGREIVRRTLAFGGPERVARSFAPSDFTWGGTSIPNPAGEWRKITPIIPDLIQAGVDLFQFDQPRLHGIDVLGQFQDSGATFWCPVDIQRTLQTRDETVIRAEAREMLAKLWRGRGGFVAGFYSDEVSIGLEPRWQQIACDEFLQRGKRELQATRMSL